MSSPFQKQFDMEFGTDKGRAQARFIGLKVKEYSETDGMVSKDKLVDAVMDEFGLNEETANQKVQVWLRVNRVENIDSSRKIRSSGELLDNQDINKQIRKVRVAYLDDRLTREEAIQELLKLGVSEDGVDSYISGWDRAMSGRLLKSGINGLKQAINQYSGTWGAAMDARHQAEFDAKLESFSRSRKADPQMFARELVAFFHFPAGGQKEFTSDMIKVIEAYAAGKKDWYGVKLQSGEKDRFKIKKVQTFKGKTDKTADSFEIFDSYWGEALDDGKGWVLTFPSREEAKKYLDDYIKTNSSLRSVQSNKVSASDNVHDWYVEMFPDDDMAYDIDATITFGDVLMALEDGRDVYELIGVRDSVVRERIFDGVDDFAPKRAYEMWRNQGRKIRSAFEQDEFLRKIRDNFRELFPQFPKRENMVTYLDSLQRNPDKLEGDVKRFGGDLALLDKLRSARQVRSSSYGTNSQRNNVVRGYLEGIGFTGAYCDEETAAKLGIEDSLSDGMLYDISISDLYQDVGDKVAEDVATFFAMCEEGGALLDGIDAEDMQVGRDFWLTRNGHGAGFWDRPELYGGKEKAEALSDIARQFGEQVALVGMDGSINLE